MERPTGITLEEWADIAHLASYGNIVAKRIISGETSTTRNKYLNFLASQGYEDAIEKVTTTRNKANAKFRAQKARASADATGAVRPSNVSRESWNSLVQLSRSGNEEAKALLSAGSVTELRVCKALRRNGDVAAAKRVQLIKKRQSKEYKGRTKLLKSLGGNGNRKADKHEDEDEDETEFVIDDDRFVVDDDETGSCDSYHPSDEREDNVTFKPRLHSTTSLYCQDSEDDLMQVTANSSSKRTPLPQASIEIIDLCDDSDDEVKEEPEEHKPTIASLSSPAPLAQQDGTRERKPETMNTVRSSLFELEMKEQELALEAVAAEKKAATEARAVEEELKRAKQELALKFQKAQLARQLRDFDH